MNTRTRHAIEYDLSTAVKKDGTIVAKDLVAYSNQGAYASHGHAIVANGITAFRHLYAPENIRAKAYTIYTNCPVGGAMRAYGIPSMLLILKPILMMWLLLWVWIHMISV